jgi:ABC-type proline/glycine betaine transport system permease subunit
VIISTRVEGNPTRAARQGRSMNHSMYGADRVTHLKIVVIALVCALVVAAIGIFAHVSSNIDLGTAALVKAGRPTSLSGNIPAIR